jgi:hypothetical protein
MSETESLERDGWPRTKAGSIAGHIAVMRLTPDEHFDALAEARGICRVLGIEPDSEPDPAHEWSEMVISAALRLSEGWDDPADIFSDVPSSIDVAEDELEEALRYMIQASMGRPVPRPDEVYTYPRKVPHFDKPVVERALDCDTEALNANPALLVALLQLRQGALLHIDPNHPHRDAIQQARDSAYREILWRLAHPRVSATAWKSIRRSRAAVQQEGGE